MHSKHTDDGVIRTTCYAVTVLLAQPILIVKMALDIDKAWMLLLVDQITRKIVI